LSYGIRTLAPKSAHQAAPKCGSRLPNHRIAGRAHREISYLVLLALPLLARDLKAEVDCGLSSNPSTLLADSSELGDLFDLRKVR
jgi:hypothetical protein